MPISDVLRAEIDRRARSIANDAMVNGDARGTLELIRSCVLHFATRAAEEAAEQCIAAVEAEFRAEENRLMELDRLRGGVNVGVGQRVAAPLIERSADLAAARLMAVAAIQRQRSREEGGSDG